MGSERCMVCGDSHDTWQYHHTDACNGGDSRACKACGSGCADMSPPDHDEEAALRKVIKELRAENARLEKLSEVVIELRADLTKERAENARLQSDYKEMVGRWNAEVEENVRLRKALCDLVPAHPALLRDALEGKGT